MKNKELQKIFEKIPEDKKNEAKLIISEIEFIKPTINKLKKEIRSKGPTEDFEQGKQKFTRERPALKSYNQLMKTYDTFLKSLLSLVPKETRSIEDEFDSFNK